VLPLPLSWRLIVASAAIISPLVRAPEPLPFTEEAVPRAHEPLTDACDSLRNIWFQEFFSTTRVDGERPAFLDGKRQAMGPSAASSFLVGRLVLHKIPMWLQSLV
jgi:hypothetical protein